MVGVPRRPDRPEPGVLGGRAEAELAQPGLAERHQTGGQEHPGEVAVAARGPPDERVAALLGRHARDVDVVLEERGDAREVPPRGLRASVPGTVERGVRDRVELRVHPFDPRDRGLHHLGHRQAAVLDPGHQPHRVEVSEGVVAEGMHARHGRQPTDADRSPGCDRPDRTPSGSRPARPVGRRPRRARARARGRGPHSRRGPRGRRGWPGRNCRSRVASDAARAYTLSRTPAAYRSKAAPMSPPMTTACGFSRLIATASTSPRWRPLSAQQAPGLGVPLQRQRDEVADVADLAARRHPGATSAQPPASVSRQPVAPQRQGRPSAASRRVWPISPAAPRWPPITWPSAMMPRPRPVEALTTRASRSVSAAPSSSGAGEHVRVVGDEERRVGDLGEVRRQRDPVPAGHHRGVEAHPVVGVDTARAGSSRRRPPAGPRRRAGR